MVTILPFISPCFSGSSSNSQSNNVRQLTLLLLSGGPRRKKVCPQWRQTSVRPLPHKVLRQLLCRVSSTDPCGIKGRPSLSALSSLHVTSFIIISLFLLSAIRSSTIRAATGMRSVSAAPSVTSLWPRSRSAPRTTASCVESAAPERMHHVAMAATNPYWLVRASTAFRLLAEKQHTSEASSYFEM